jgi:hypothetical protein
MQPDSEEEWAFLRRCALDQYEYGWADAGAIQTLKLIASPKSLQILREAQQHNPRRTISAATAIEYVAWGPPVLASESLIEAAMRVADAVRIGEWEGNSNIRLNREGDKALVDMRYYTGQDVLTYTGTFHRVDGVWRLRGVRETLQEFAAPRSPWRPALPDLPQPPELISTPPQLLLPGPPKR